MEDYQGTEKLTEISARQWQYVTQENLSAREAVAFLRSGMQVRSFRDVLRQVCGTDQVEQQLTLALCQLSDAQPDSVRRKVWNWMNGRTLPTEREEVLRICFALELPLEQADRMLTLLTDQGIHYRNLWEVVCAYCLRQGLPYGEAKRLMEQLRPSGSRECGMRRIDPRSVFDYLLLYCLLPEDDMAMSQRMSALAVELFAET